MLQSCSLDDEEKKQDSELKGCRRLMDRLKKHFPRLKIMILLDNLYACDSIITMLKEKRWEFMIKLPAKLKTLYDPLKDRRDSSAIIPNQPYYRERKQKFHWINNIEYRLMALT